MRVMMFGHRKQSAVLYDISTPEKEAAGWLAIFWLLDNDMEAYGDIEDEDADAPENHRYKYAQQREWHAAARAGNAEAAQKLITLRKRLGYEYEDEWSIEEVMDPRVIAGEIKKPAKKPRVSK